MYSKTAARLSYSVNYLKISFIYGQRKIVYYMTGFQNFCHINYDYIMNYILKVKTTEVVRSK